MIRLPQRLPDPQTAWFDPQTGKPVIAVYQYFREIDQALRSVIAITNATNDPVTFANLPTGTEGRIIYVSNGRKNGEGVGLGTGVLAFYDGAAWIAVDTGTAVAA